MKPLMAASTARFVESYATARPQGLLLVGPKGTGLMTLARYLAESNGSVMSIIEPESKTASSLRAISVERIRQLYVETRSLQARDYFVIIDDADTMNASAQNALLKLLEEPNQSIKFILTTHHGDGLLPTVRSRTQSFSVPPLDAAASHLHLKRLGIKDELAERQLLYLAEGLPAEMARLAASDAALKNVASHVKWARQFIEGNTYERLAAVQSLKDDRQGSLELIETIMLLLRRTIKTGSAIEKAKLLERLIETTEAIRANGNVKLHLSKAVL